MIVFNEDGCIKCGACQGACPTSAIDVKPDSIIHCDTCGEEPKCADVCPNGALKAEAFEIVDGVSQIRLVFNSVLCDYANIVVATIQNNPAMEMGIHQVAKDYIKPGMEVDDSIFNLMEMVIRAYDPCLSCATHSMDSQMRLAEVNIVDSEGNLIKRF